MKGKKLLSVALAAMLILSMALFNVGVAFASPLPYLSIEPSSVYYEGDEPDEWLGEEFSITVVVHDVTDYYGCDFEIDYSGTLLEYQKAKTTVYGPNAVVNVNDTNPLPLGALTIVDVSVLGTVKYSCLFRESYDMDPATPETDSPPSFNGTGVVAWVFFKIIDVPPQDWAPPDFVEVSCPLAFVEAMTFIYDPTPAAQPRDPCVNGLYTYRMINLIKGAPTADFDYSPKIPFVSDTVSLWDTSDPGPPPSVIVSWEWTITGPVDGVGPLDQAQAYFHCAGPGNVIVTLKVTNDANMSDTETKTIEQREVIGCFLDVYTSTNRFCGQTTEYVGEGLHEPCDALSPDVNVTLFAEVTWNNAPVMHVLVAFEVRWLYYIDWQDPTMQLEPNWVPIPEEEQQFLYRTAETDKDGIARIWFRVPTPCPQHMFGKWIVIATAKVQEVKQEDTMPFDVGYLITIVSVETDAPEYIRDCSLMTIKVYAKNIAWMPKTVTFVITVYDDCDVPIGQFVHTNTYAAGYYCSPAHLYPTFVNAIHIPQWAYVGIGKVYVSAFTALPKDCGVPYCPEKSCIFDILYVA